MSLEQPSKNREVDKIAKALVGFQSDMENVTKDAVNPFFKSKYASLEAILTAAKPHLKKHGLAVVQMPEHEGLTTMIIHESGQFIEARADLKIKEMTPQGHGSAITYMRRYALSAALGIATEDDDDGNAASTPSKPAKTVPPAKEKSREVLADKDPKIAEKAVKERIATLVKKIKGDPPKGTKEQLGSWYADQVYDLTKKSLKLSDTAELEAIAEELADIEI